MWGPVGSDDTAPVKKCTFLSIYTHNRQGFSGMSMNAWGRGYMNVCIYVYKTYCMYIYFCAFKGSCTEMQDWVFRVHGLLSCSWLVG